MTKHTFYAMKLNTAVIGGITGQDVSLNPELMGDASSGQVNRSIVSLTAVKPTASLSGKAVGRLLDEISQLGEGISGSNVLTLFAYQHAAGGTREGTLKHRTYTINSGILVPRRLSVPHRGDAVLTFDVIITWDGSNDPIVITDLQSVPAIDGGDDERYTLGPVSIGGITLTGLRQLDIDFGINAPTEGADSEVYDRIVSVETATPVITLRGIDIEWFKATVVPILGLAATHANTTMYLRKKAAAGTFVDDGTAEHVAITAAGLGVLETVFGGQPGAAAESSVRLETLHDGTNLPLVIDTSAAIT